MFYSCQKNTIGHGTKLHKTDFKSFIHSKTCYQQAIVEEGKREITEHRFYAEIVTDITKRNSERKDT